MDAADLIAQLAAHLGVECRKRLVEQQHARLDRKRAGQRDALLLASRKLVRVSRGVGSEPYEPQHLVSLLPASGPVHASHAQPKGDVVARGQVREQAVCLEDHAHVALAGRHVLDVLAADEHLA